MQMGMTFGFSGVVVALILFVLLSAVRIFASTNAASYSRSAASGK